MSAYEQRRIAYEERRLAYERRERAIKLASTYLRKAEAYLYEQRRAGEPPSANYWSLLDVAIGVATEIVESLGDDFFEQEVTPDFFGLMDKFGLDKNEKSSLSDEPYEAAQKLLTLFEARRGRTAVLGRIRLLESVEGRTPEEAEAYLAKARELRAGL